MIDEEILGKFRWNGYHLPEDCEERMGEHFFTEYAFVQSPKRGLREIYFTCCGERMTFLRGTPAESYRDNYQRELETARHNDMALCPICEATVLVKHLGRLRGGEDGDFTTLRECRNVVLLDANEGTLLISAGRLYRRWIPGDRGFSGWPGETELSYPWPEAETWFTPWRQYAVRPGQIRAWKRVEVWAAHVLIGYDWASVKVPGPHPFQRASVMMRDPEDGQYITIGTEAVAETDLKYCAIDRYLAGDGLDWEDGVYGRSVAEYLLEYARHPQLEMLTKLGHRDVIHDLLDNGQRNGALLNWRATTPPGFFRLTKPEYKSFRAAGGTLAELQQVREAKQLGVSVDVYFAEKRRLTEGLRRPVRGTMHDCGELSQVCGVSLHTAVSYAIRHGGTSTWMDYILAAQKLDYDLTRLDVSMPKNLRERHDATVALARVNGDRKAVEYYRKHILPQLRRRYEFTYDGLQILVPLNGEEIVAEGKAMRHCVGGYAARHLEGRVVILFLRREEQPEEPFVTIEMNGDNLIQARGYHNDWDVSTTPQTRHPEFSRVWLDWVKAGSPRMQDGAPVLPRRLEVQSS